MDAIGDDLFTDIALRLPTPQVGQMRCVSKLWNSLLSKPDFVKSHLEKSFTNNTNLILFIHKDINPTKHYYTLRAADNPDIVHRSFEPPVDDFGTIVGGLNGLVCLTSGKNNIHIWNPFISMFKTLPTSPLCVHPLHVDVSSGFGFDDRNDDYKVVKITSVWGRNGLGRVQEQKEAEVFSLREDCWRLVPNGVPSRITYLNRHDVPFIDGRLYWLGNVFDGNWPSKYVIVWFDLGSEMFGEVSLPDSRVGESSLLGSMRERLALFSSTRHEYCEVWVMSCGSWVKELVLGSPFVEMMVVPMRFTFNGGFLFKTDDDPLVWYDPESFEIKKSGIRDLGFASKVALYVESLVWSAS